ncbi:MXAN_5187 family protein [Myxococcus sp. Y35]|uniref:MXAN_5187 family protein n=1 Tax=Pseudomyxococcus flavus TaxID=3115648 RepID=UPI003CE692A5
MVRLKFLVFAFLVIGLGVAHLPMLSGPLRERAVAGASAQASAGAAEVARRVETRRAEVQSLALKLAAMPEVVSAAVPALPEQPAPRNARERERAEAEAAAARVFTAERFAAVRSAVEAVIPQELKGAVVAVAAQDAQFHAVAGAEPSSDAAKLDVVGLIKSGASVSEAFGAPHAFAAVPLAWSAGAPSVTLVLGAPLLDEGGLEAAVQASGVAALALVKGEALAGVAGPQKLLAEGSLSKVAADTSGVVLSTGKLLALGPVSLPVFTQVDDFMGGKAPLMVGTRRALAGTPLEVLAIASTQPVLGTLAAYQQNALFALAGLLGLSLLWTLMMGSGRKAVAEEDSSGSSDTLSLSAAMASKPAPVASQPPAPAAEPAPAADPFAFAPPAAAPAADPFAFAPPAAPPAPAADPFAFAPPAPAPAPAADPFAFAPPAAPAADPFAMAAPPPAGDPFAMSPPAQAPVGDPFAFAPPAPPPAADPFAFAPPPPPPAPAAAPFGSAEAFPFPAPPQAPASASAMPFEPAAEPFAGGPEPLAPAAPRRGAFAFEDQPTAAYSLQQAADPFALAAAQATPDSPETTRVAAIPRELLQASARPPTSDAIPMPPPRPAAGAQAAVPLPGLGNSAVALSDEQHFQEVFREFVSTRERCGEAADGLTYDKFVQKLRKNKEQLVQKYACKTVRFQVYVKEGKAALKATPVKD